jgi:hypothetical protein
MVGTKKSTRNAGRSLIAALLLTPVLVKAEPYKLGVVTQAEGEISFLDFTPPHHRLKTIKAKHTFLTEGSYLTQDDSFLTVRMFDESSWLRLSPRSKLAPEFNPKNKTLIIHLFTGSVKVLFSSTLSQEKITKIVVKSADGSFESSEGKFTVVRNNITDTSRVYVEKGTVVSSFNSDSSQDLEIVHAQETTTITDRQSEVPSPRKMTEKELRFLHPSKYLHSKDSKI